MSRYFESICIEGGKARNLPYHQSRMEETRTTCLGLSQHPVLSECIKVPEAFLEGVAKCRVVYDRHIQEIQFEPYVRRSVSSLKLVTSHEIDYAYKAEDRSLLNALFAQRGECDDILIIKNGWVTDSYVSNIVLWNGQEWHTPHQPLLPGTMRAALLASAKIKAVPLHLVDLHNYMKIRLINAFHTLKEAPEVSINDVIS